jgi:hypothetical protein
MEDTNVLKYEGEQFTFHKINPRIKFFIKLFLMVSSSFFQVFSLMLIIGKENAHYSYNEDENSHGEKGSQNGDKEYLIDKIPINHHYSL